MMRWPWTRRLPDPEELQRDSQLQRNAEYRHRAISLADEAQALMDKIEEELARRESRNSQLRKPRGT